MWARLLNQIRESGQGCALVFYGGANGAGHVAEPFGS